MRISVVIIGVTGDMQRAVQFYRKALGFTPPPLKLVVKCPSAPQQIPLAGTQSIWETDLLLVRAVHREGGNGHVLLRVADALATASTESDIRLPSNRLRENLAMI
jgi:catechol 2,3-dioxygenase-like lactoylglutathione lyase family enzyme